MLHRMGNNPLRNAECGIIHCGAGGKKQTSVDEPGGSETVLIVEDDNRLLKLAQKVHQEI